MAVTIFAAWFTGSTQARRRIIGFWCFIFSNALWVIWGWHDHAYALIALEVALGAMNLRGLKKIWACAGMAITQTDAYRPLNCILIAAIEIEHRMQQTVDPDS